MAPDARAWFTATPASRRRRLAGGRRVAPGRIERGGRVLRDFGSNDYLGLSWHPALREAARRALSEGPLGAGASRYVAGDDDAWHELEAELAAWKGYEAALVAGSGMLLNMGLLQALAGRRDAIFADRLVHASLVDGARLARARLVRYRHLRPDALAGLLARTPAQRRVIVTDGVFSMDGDCADVRALLALAEEHDAIVVLDDAHGTGVVGPDGRGLAAACDAAGHPRLVEVGTFGKALGGYGAFVLGPAAFIEGLRQRLRTAIYSTMPPPLLAHAMLRALALVREGTLVRALHERIRAFRELAAARGHAATDTAIQPWVLGSDEAALAAARRLEDAGFFVPAIRPPTVPEGTARLRISLSAAHPLEAVEALVEALGA